MIVLHCPISLKRFQKKRGDGGRWGSALRWIEVVIKHPACKMTPNGRGWGRREPGGGLEGIGRWVGMQETPTPSPYFTRLPFFSCCESKLQHINLLSPECKTRLKLGMMMMMMTMITMVTVTIS